MTQEHNLPSCWQWQTLHNSYERYEQYALVIKLISISLTLVSLTLTLNIMLLPLIIVILWLQEAIWKTYQSRLSDVIIKLEQERKSAYPLYSNWQEKRPSTGELVNEYINSAIKPTVAFPYAPLIGIALFFH